MNSMKSTCTSRRRPWVLLGLGVIFLSPLLSPAGCGGCEGQGPLQYVQADAAAVLEIPSLHKAVVANLAFLNRVTKGPLAQALTRSRLSMLKREFGLDLTDTKSFRSKGVDPKAGLVVSVDNEGMIALVMPVMDGPALDKYLRRQLTRHSSGAISFADQVKDGLKATLAKHQPSSARGSIAGWAFHHDHLIAVVTLMGKTSDDVLVKLKALTKVKKSIKQNQTFMDARKALTRFDVLAYIDAKAVRRRVTARSKALSRFASRHRKKTLNDELELQEGLLSYVEGLSFAWHAEHTRLELKALLSVPKARHGVLREILSGEGDAPPFARYISAKALLAGRVSVHPKQLFDHAIQLLPPRQKRDLYQAIDRWEQRNNLNLNKDILGAFAGRFALALFPPAMVANQPSSRLFGLGLVAMAQVKDPKHAAKLLDRIERFLVVNRHAVRTRSKGRRKIFHLSTAGEKTLTWSVVNNIFLVTTPEQFDGAVALMEEGGASIRDHLSNPRAKRLLDSDRGQVLYQDLAKLSVMLKKVDLPLPLRLILTPAIDAFDTLEDVTLGAEVAPQGIRADLTLRTR
ncbi:MAG: DUF3352 domain-containing protein [Deltaproteobacteria bacterium]|nr:DUF3352 domain-containing protein [Deltaproteobacteria bacterium]